MPTKAKTTAAKPSKAKAAKAVTVTETIPPINAGPSKAEQAREQYSAERRAASTAVSEYYAGASLPFKPASGTFKPINDSNAKRPSLRQAAAIAAMLVHGSDNIKADGTFKRGGFTIPATLIDPKAPADKAFSAQPESGVLGNMLGQAVHYVSGPQAGAAQREAIYRFDFDAIAANYIPLLPATVRIAANAALQSIRAA